MLNINVSTERKYHAKFDDSLFDVYVLDYDDNYHRMAGEPTTEQERAVRNIRARYKDIVEFNEALATYNEWMDYLASKNGGHQILKKKIKAGVLLDFIPRKPRLKNNKTLKYMHKHGIIVSNTGKKLTVLEDMLEQCIEMYSDTTEKVTVSMVKDKEADKISDDMENSGMTRYKTSSFMSDAEFLDSYFSSRKTKKSTKGKKNNKKKQKKEKFLLTDLMNGKYDYDDIEESENAPLMSYNGLLLSTGTTKEMEVYHKLDEIGWNSYKLMKRANYSKRITNSFKVKKKKKNKKNKGPQSDYEGLLIDIMSDNGYDDFADFSKDMLNMTSKNVFK